MTKNRIYQNQTKPNKKTNESITKSDMVQEDTDNDDNTIYNIYYFFIMILLTLLLCFTLWYSFRTTSTNESSN